MTKRVLAVFNFEKTGLGLVGEALADAGVTLDAVNAHEGAALLEGHDGHDGIVVLGGGQDALDDAGSVWFPRLLTLMRGFAQADKAVLGICLGSQLLARALGGQNHIGGHTEFGWSEVALTPEGAADPLFADVPERFAIFQWHDDHFSLPAGATRLAASPIAGNQAFRFGRAAYGTQFHFEADTALVRQWNTDFSAHIAEHKAGWPHRHEDEEAAYGAAADAAGRAIARAWVSVL